MRSIFLLVVAFVAGLARSDDRSCPAIDDGTTRTMIVVSASIFRMESPPDRYRRLIVSMGKWELLPLEALKPFEPDLDSFGEGDSRFSSRDWRLRSVVPRGYRPIRYEVALSRAIGRSAWLEGVVFEDRTNLNYQERLITGTGNTHAYGVAVLVLKRW